MTDPNQTEDAREADAIGERPDLGRTRDSLIDALSGTDSGSDTRAGSLQGGASTGSDDDPDQDVINEALATEGMKSAGEAAANADDDPQSPSSVGPDAVKNTGVTPGGADEDPAEGRRGPDGAGEADAATG